MYAQHLVTVSIRPYLRSQCKLLLGALGSYPDSISRVSRQPRGNSSLDFIRFNFRVQMEHMYIHVCIYVFVYIHEHTLFF